MCTIVRSKEIAPITITYLDGLAPLCLSQLMERIEWAQLDVYGQVIGTPYTGDVEGLRTYISNGVQDLATFTRKDDEELYLKGRTIRCTMLTMTVPWGRYRFIPADATRMPPRPRRFHWGIRRGVG
jgi:hypothetical protein